MGNVNVIIEIEHHRHDVLGILKDFMLAAMSATIARASHDLSYVSITASLCAGVHLGTAIGHLIAWWVQTRQERAQNGQ